MKIVIIGAGFYGTSIAIYLSRFNFIKSIMILEKESNVISRASLINQGRIHNGYHYPRSFSTGYRSHNNFENFVNEWEDCIDKSFDSYYVISKNNSKVSSNQFVKFCSQIGSPIKEANSNLKKLFNNYYVENIFKVKEYIFNGKAIRNRVLKDLKIKKIKLSLNCRVTEVINSQNKLLDITYEENNSKKTETADIILNCTYSGLSQLDNTVNKKVLLKHEITELVLVDLPKHLRNMGITVMDGPFFSILPYPAYNTSSISHVRYTPHLSWLDSEKINPYKKLNDYDKTSRFERIIRDSSKYIPSLVESKYKESLFEIKTVLYQNEIDDGRPILFKEHPSMKNFYSILGAKIDNVFDVFSCIKKIIYK